VYTRTEQEFVGQCKTCFEQVYNEGRREQSFFSVAVADQFSTMDKIIESSTASLHYTINRRAGIVISNNKN